MATYIARVTRGFGTITLEVFENQTMVQLDEGDEFVTIETKVDL